MFPPHHWLRLAYAALMVCLAGCQIVRIPASVANTMGPLKESPWVPIFRKELARVEWTGPPRTRWLEPTLEPAAAEQETATWSWRAVSVGHIPAGEGSEAKSQLAAALQLFRTGDPAGDHAVILVARHAPEHCAELLDALAEITCESFSSRQAAEPNTPRNHASNSERQPEQANASPPADSRLAELRKANAIEQPSPTGKPADSPQQLAIRCAAAETWFRVLASQSENPTENDFAPLGLAIKHFSLPEAVRGTLWQALAREFRPDVIPGLADAFRRSTRGPIDTAVVRRMAMEACLIHATTHQPDTESRSRMLARTFEPDRWPDSIWNCRSDPDPTVRRLFGRWLAWSGHPDAVTTLKSQFLDTDPQVRDDAALSLGLIDSESARTELHKLLKSDLPGKRQLAVRGIARQELAAIRGMIHDPSSQVRQQVARELCAVPAMEQALLLRELLGDRNPEVQRTVVENLGDWPDEFALPLIWESLRIGVMATRQAGVVVLRERLGFEPALPLESSPAEREAAIREFAREQQLPTGFPAQTTLVAHRTLRSDLELDGIWSDLVALLQLSPQSREIPEVLQRLESVSAEEIPLVERALLEIRGQSQQQELIWSRVLSPVSSGHAALMRMDNADVSVRRSAARDLRRFGEQRSLTTLMLRKLAELLTNEQDRIVWQEAFAAVMEDDSPDAAHIALRALHHQWPDIRLLGCKFLARHPSSQGAVWLVPLFRDSHRETRLAAIQTVGLCRNPIVLDGLPANPTTQTAAVPGLRPLLLEADAEIRLAVVESMVQLHDETAIEELSRLTVSPVTSVRRNAVRIMGGSHQSRFVETLIRLGWTEKTPAVQETVLESLSELVPVDQRPIGLIHAGSPSEKIRLWADWWQSRAAR